MLYQIAGVIIDSEFHLPFPSDFAYNPAKSINPADAADRAKADVVLEEGGALPPVDNAFDAGSLKICRLSEGWLFQPAGKEDAGLIANEDYTRLRLVGTDVALAEMGSQIEWLIRTALESFLIRRGYVSLHAAAVEVDGEAYAFTAPSGTGKSTRACAWQEAFGAQLISGDRPLIKVGRKVDDKSIAIDGIVDVPELFGVPWDGKEKCYRNERYPLKMICEVRRSDRAYARKLTFEQRRRLLMQQSFVPMWDTETSAMQMINIIRLAETAQIVRIFGGPLPEDAQTMRTILDHNQLKEEEADMKAKSGFILRNVVGEHVLMPTGDNIGKYNGTIVLNDVAALVWEKLQNPVSREDLIAAILDEYNVEEDVAATDLDKLLETLKGYGVIEE